MAVPWAAMRRFCSRLIPRNPSRTPTRRRNSPSTAPIAPAPTTARTASPSVGNMPGGMREVSGPEIAAHIDVAAILPAMRDALRAEAEGQVEVPLRAGWQLGGADFGMLAMPARSAALNFAIFKM